MQPQVLNSSQAEPEACQDLQNFGVSLGPVQHRPRPSSKKVANLNLASVLIRPLGIHDFPSEGWKQAILQLLLLSQVELVISANYLWLFLFGLKTKIRRYSVKCSWRRIEGESPLYTCPDPDTLQPWTSLTTLTPALMQHNKNQPLTCTWFGSDTSLHLKPAKDNKSWLLIEKILWHYLVFRAEVGWVHTSPMTILGAWAFINCSLSLQ